MRAIGVRAAVVGLIAAIAASWTVAQSEAPKGAPPREGAASEEPQQAGTDSRTEMRIETKPIPPPVVYEFSRTVGPGRVVKKSDGKPGTLTRVYTVYFENGKPVSKELIDERREEPSPVLFYMGRSGFTASRHKFLRGKVLTMEATAYDPSAGRGRRATYRTSSGRRAEFGMIAVDPKVIPMGTHLYIEGYGMGLAADRGSAIMGNRIDLCFPTRAQAMRFGRKMVRVHILR